MLYVVVFFFFLGSDVWSVLNVKMKCVWRDINHDPTQPSFSIHLQKNLRGKNPLKTFRFTGGASKGVGRGASKGVGRGASKGAGRGAKAGKH